MGGEICDENSKSVDSVLVFGKGRLGNVPNRSHPRARVEFVRPSPNAEAKENVRLTHSAPRIVGTRATRASRARTSRESKRARSDAKDDARAVRRNRDQAVREAHDVLTMFSTARVVPLDV